MRETLAAAYAQSTFRLLLPDAPIVRRIGVVDSAADAALRRAGCVAHWHVLTPCNPFSRALSDDENALRLRDCAQRIAACSWRHVAAINSADDGRWPEPGFALFDADAGAVEALGCEFGQNAIVHAQLGEAPQLLWLAG